jgi:hypothetical protein
MKSKINRMTLGFFWALGLLTTALVVGGAAPPPDATQGSTTADVTFARRTDGVSSALQWFLVEKDEKCSGASKVLAIFRHHDNRTSIGPTKLPAGERTYFRAHAKALSLPMEFKCGNIASLVLEAGHNYAISQTVSQNACKLEVKDISTGAEPASLVRYSAEGRCR